MYADGTHLKCTGNDIYSIQSSLNLDLPNISNCLTANKLTFNMTKTEFMLIGSRQKLNNLPAPPALEINSTHINQAHSTGIIIDENLTWVNHIDTLSKKNAAGIGATKRIRHCAPPATLHSIYRGIVQSHFDYCKVVWDSCGNPVG